MNDPKLHAPELAVARLHERVAELEAEYFQDDRNPVTVWEAIRLIADHNKACSITDATMAFPFPLWINDYLLRSSEKIGRLSCGIRPEDDRELDASFDGWGDLMARPDGRSGRVRDTRADHVASALGFVSKGANAFQRHDRASMDRHNVRLLYEVRHRWGLDVSELLGIMAAKNHMTKAAYENRLSIARGRMGKTRR